MIMDDLVSELCKYGIGYKIIVEYDEGKTILEGIIKSFPETYYGYDEEDEDYKEYYSCRFVVTKILSNGSEIDYQKDDKIELSEVFPPYRILTESGDVIWNKNNIKRM